MHLVFCVAHHIIHHLTGLVHHVPVFIYRLAFLQFHFRTVFHYYFTIRMHFTTICAGHCFIHRFPFTIFHYHHLAIFHGHHAFMRSGGGHASCRVGRRCGCSGRRTHRGSRIRRCGGC